LAVRFTYNGSVDGLVHRTPCLASLANGMFFIVAPSHLYLLSGSRGTMPATAGA
jgi:hypothetical protein